MTASGMAEGTVIQDRYRLVRMLGAGGMGEVWEAQHKQLPKVRYAIKFLFGDSQGSEQFERFSREAKILHHLDHVNITKIYDMQLDHTPPFIALEYLEGEPLSARLKRSRSQGERGLAIGEVSSIVKQVRDALEVTHRQGVIHRDLKPENIYLCYTEGSQDALVKVLDFGVSKMSGERQITQHQQGFLGTPQYMSPEQALGNENLDSRADQFSLAIILYEMLSGELPFKGEQIVQIATQIVHGDPPYIRELTPYVPEPAAQALHRALCKSPEDRFPDCTSFIDTFIAGTLIIQEDDEWAMDSRTEVGMRHSLVSGLSPIVDPTLATEIEASQGDYEGPRTIKMNYQPELYTSEEYQQEAESSQTVVERQLRPPTIQFRETPRSDPEFFPSSEFPVVPATPRPLKKETTRSSSKFWLIPLVIIAIIGGALSTRGGEPTLSERAQLLNESPAIKGALIMPEVSSKLVELSLVERLTLKQKKRIKRSKRLPRLQKVVSPKKTTFLLSSLKDAETKAYVEGLELHWFGPKGSHITHKLSPLPTLSKERAIWRAFHTFRGKDIGRWVALLTAKGSVVAELPFEVK